MQRAVVLLVAVLLGLGGWATARRTHDERVAAVRCPAGGVAGFGTVDEAIAAARRLRISGKTISSQGHTYRLTPKNSPVLEVVQLAPDGGRPLPGAAELRRIATRRCGKKLAAAAWAVAINIPFVQIAASSEEVAFVVKTTRGWKAF
jgi:uncharacterized protein YjhX (UPF0386 family)